MNVKTAKKIRKETRNLYERELRGYRRLPFWERLKVTISLFLVVLGMIEFATTGIIPAGRFAAAGLLALVVLLKGK